MASSDAVFAGSIPALYHRCLGPLLFQPYADDLARRIATARPRRVLETAAGTGIVSEAILERLPDVELTATDLNGAMLEVAGRRLDRSRLRLLEADAQQLPFEDGSFDLVACQFGVMFFPDRIAAYREALRVLGDGGCFIFNVWNRLSENPASDAAAAAVASLFPHDPPSFLSRVPFGYHDKAQVEQDLRSAGFERIEAETVRTTGRGASAREAAVGLCQGSPLRSEIEARDPERLAEATAAAERAIAELLGDGEIENPMSAHVFTATRSG